MRPYELRRFASLSKNVHVVSQGKTYETSEPDKDSDSLAAVVSEFRVAAGSIHESQEQVMSAMRTATDALYQPVVPVYENGKLLGARRVPASNDDVVSALSEIRVAARTLKEGQERVIKAAQSIVDAMYQPVVPVFDKGKLTGARRERNKS